MKKVDVKSTTTIKEAIYLFNEESIEMLIIDEKIAITKDVLLKFYEQQIPLDISLKLAMSMETNFPLLENSLYKSLIEHLPFSLYVTDAKGNPILANEDFIKTTGMSKEEVLSTNVLSLVESRIYSPAVTPIVIHEKRSISINQQLKNDSNTVVTGIPIFNEEGDLSMVVTVSQNKDVIKPYAIKHELSFSNEGIIYKSEQMKEIMDIAHQVANVDSTVLITGESGVGKDVVSNFIHMESQRSEKPFIHLNCGAIPEQLLESELFGYEPGTFTGGNKKGKKGHIEAANEGTLFLDEIGEMSVSLQVKLLQVIQNKQIIRMGSTTPIDVDIRIIAATNRDLQEDIKTGLFRLDLYYRLNVIPLYIPPLRERREDILPLAHYFLEEYNKKNNKQFQITFEIEQILKDSNWPGNIRELENFIERLVVIERHEQKQLKNYQTLLSNGSIGREPIEVNAIIPLKDAVDMVEKKLIEKAAMLDKNSYKIAELLSISQSSAHRKIQKHL